MILTCATPVHATPDFDAFASCIQESGARYYGAHWCPQCERQTAMFERGAQRLPYIECEEEGARGQLAHCADIDAYPTWLFADGRKRTGVLSLERLADYTNCELTEQSHFRYPSN